MLTIDVKAEGMNIQPNVAFFGEVGGNLCPHCLHSFLNAAVFHRINVHLGAFS